MRSLSPVPAQQLRSVASRYGQSLLPPTHRGGLRRQGSPAALTTAGGAWDPGGRLDTGSPLNTGSLAADHADPTRQLRMRRLEAILLLAREPLSSRKLAQYANLADGTEARTLIRRLNQTYDALGRAFRVEEFAGGFQMLTRPTFAPWLRRLEHVPPETRLSAPALETLAVVAYRQPVLRADIEAIRGVSCGEILRQLMERDLVRIGGRSEELGRPYLYSTTRRFLQLMGLATLDQLPRADLLRTPLVATTETGNTKPSPNQLRSPADRHPEEADMIATESELLQPELELTAVAMLAAVSPQLQADEEDDFEEEFEDDDDEEFEDDDELEDDEEFEDEEDDFEDDEEFEEEEEELEDAEEVEADVEEVEEEEDEAWEEVDDEDEDDEEWEDDDMDWEDEFDEMEE